MAKSSRRHRSGSLPADLPIPDLPWVAPVQTPPDGLPSYRLITGKDDAAFCQRVSEALKLGYRLHGSPAVTFNGTDVIAAQAVLWPFFEDDCEIPF